MSFPHRLSAALALVVIIGCTSASGGNKVALVPTSVANGISARSTTAPPGFDVAGAQWITIDRADGRRQLAAIFVPDGPGPFPTVVYLHGSSGLGRAQLQWLPRLADAGYLVLAGCYLGAADPTAYVPCDGLPPNDPTDVTNTVNGYDALVRTAHALGPARRGQIGIVGVSFGAAVALGAGDRSVAAIVADAGHGSGPSAAGDAPVLLLGFTVDLTVPHDEMIAYEDAMRAAGKSVESHYFEGTGHTTTLAFTTSDDAIRRTIAFLDGHLKER